jgi:hypothetical protein
MEVWPGKNFLLGDIFRYDRHELYDRRISLRFVLFETSSMQNERLFESAGS